MVVGRAGPGEIIGEMSAIDGSSRSATVVADEPLEASYIARDAFRAAIQRRPEVAMRLLTMLVQRLRDADARLAGLEEGKSIEPLSGGADVLFPAARNWGPGAR